LSSPLTLYDYVHGRYFNFTEFEGLGKEFVTALAGAFVKYSSTVASSTAQSSFSTAVKFLRWILANQLNLREFVSALRLNHAQARAEDWEDAVAQWQISIDGEESLQAVAKHNFICVLNKLTRKLMMFGVIPKFELVNPPRPYRESRPTKTLAEVAHDNSDQRTEAILNEALSGTNCTDIELAVKRDFLKTLIDETGAISGTPQEHARVLMKINAERLAAIRSAAEQDFIKWVDWWNEGQQALRDCDMSFEEISTQIHMKETCHYYAKLFPSKNEHLSLGRLLTYVTGHPSWQGQVIGLPTNPATRSIEVQVTRFGAETLQARLFPHIDLTCAVIVLVLCDTGANVSVARTLPKNCLDSSENRGYKVIRGNKMRSSGKLIANELPVKDNLHKVSSVQAIQTYQKISQVMRVLALDNYSKSLFLQLTSHGVVRDVRDNKWTRWFRSFCKRHDEIAHLRIQGRMIRPSVVMQAAFDKETGIIAAAAIADHSSEGTTNPYISRYPTQVVWERMIREFQSLFQAVSIYSINEAARKLGLTEKYVKRLFSEACRTGLGVACLDPRSGIQPGSEKGNICTQLQNCTTCPNRVVVATVENLTDLILWNHHLEQSRIEWELSRPEKWARDWLPWLVFTQVIIEQAGRGRTVPEFKKATIIARAIIERGELNFPLLW
jgi:hypothetical protein